LLCDSPQVQDAIGRADAILKAGRAETDRGNVKATEPAPLHPSASLNPQSRSDGSGRSAARLTNSW